MTIAYSTKVNQRALGSEQLIVGEQHFIGTAGVDTSEPDFIKLIEVPLQEVPSSVVISGFTEVTTAPGTNEFLVDYTSGRIQFDSSKNGQLVAVTYKGRGSLIDAVDINEVQIPVGIALKIDGDITDGHVKPPAISTNPADNFTFPNDVTVTGNLDVQGTMTTIQTEILTIDDNIVLLNSNVTGSPTEDAGLEIERGTDPNVQFIWNETNDSWQLKGTAGTALFEVFDSGAIFSPGTIQLADGTAPSPSLTFTSDTDTGLFKAGTTSISISVSGVEHTRFHDTNGIEMSIGQLLAQDGSALAPGVSFGANPNAGVYNVSGSVRVSANGGEAARFTENGGERQIALDNPPGVSTTNVPSYSFIGDEDSGLVYFSFVDTVSLQKDGTRVIDIDNLSGVKLTFQTVQHNVDGTAALPALTFGTDPDLGWYRLSPNTIALGAGGIGQWSLSDSLVSLNAGGGQILTQDGTAALPTYSFVNDTNTGISRDGADNLLLSTAGLEALRVDSAQNIGIGTGASPAAKLHNAGDTVFGLTTAADPVSIPAPTVDDFTGVVISTTGAVVVTLPSPTNTTAGRFFTTLHDDGSSGTLSVNGSNIGVGKGSTFMWDGSAWIPVGTTGGFEVLGSDPGSPVTGDVWFNTADSQFKGYNGSEIVVLG